MRTRLLKETKIHKIEHDHDRIYMVCKSVFDTVTAFLASILLLVPCAAIALMIVIKDRGNPFYQQERVGKNGERIKILKFRTMKSGADNLEQMLTPEQLEDYRREWKLEDDPRLIGYKVQGDGKTCFGAVLRRTSIDEVPQIFYNILWKRNMSVVGPRPILPEELSDNYTPEEQKLLLSVKPGLTGYWQAYARNNATYETGERQRMELHYVQNSSGFFDVKIMIQTVITVIKKTGAL